MKALLINVELSDQTGKSAIRLVGIFDNDAALEAAKIAADKHYYEHRKYFIEIECQTNQFLPLPRWRDLI